MEKRNHVVLVSKDATLPEYFGPYGSKYTHTPNIDALAEKGTVFRRHYTAAPSTAMSFCSMFTGKYPYETDKMGYVEVKPYEGTTLFDVFHERGYECHLMWSNNYVIKAEVFAKCFGKHTIHHDAMKFNQSCGNATYVMEGRKRDEELAQQSLNMIIQEIDNTIDYKTKDIFLWIHMPHCIKGRISYGDDIDIFDSLIGALRERFGDDNMFVTADHGHMNGLKHKTCYGFDVYDRAARIPLITPRIDGLKNVEFVTSNIQLMDIIANRNLKRLPYVIVDSAYYGQLKRKTAIVKDNYMYIYNKYDKSEELYDLELDPHQDINLLSSPIWRDEDRDRHSDIRQLVFYPDWNRIPEIADELRNILKSIWRVGPWKYELRGKIRGLKITKKLYFFIDKYKKRKK